MEKDFLGMGGGELARRAEIDFFNHPGGRPFSSIYSPNQPFLFLPETEGRSTGIPFDVLPSSAYPFTSNFRFQPQKSAFFRQPPEPFPTLAAPFSRRTTSNPAQLTIFYAGSISVFDEVPADKARAIMLMASNAARVNSELLREEAGDVVSAVPSASGSSASDELSAATIAPRSGFQGAAIPLARKASLARFMEKRKERLSQVQPYFSFKPDFGAAGRQL